MKIRNIQYIKCAMFFINIFSVLSLTIFIYITTQRICSYFIAREFIGQVDALPGQPKLLIYQSAAILAVLFITYVVREILYPEVNKVVYITLVIDFLCSISLIFLLDFNYNGLLLMVFANLVANIKGTKGRYFLMFLAIASFLIADYELIAINYQLFSIHNYISYYDTVTQQYLLGFYNLLISMNIVVFFIYCIYVIQSQRETIDEVNQLYHKLSSANEELANANVQLQEYAAITEKMGETRERNRLAREIHDTLGHTLTGISAGLDACITTITGDPGETRKRLELLADVTRQGIKEIRRSVSELRPDALDRLTLEHAIQKMIIDTNRVTNTKIYFQSDVKTLKFDEDEENAVYRIIQESLTNAIRHGEATIIWITLKQIDSMLHLAVKDNGKGAAEIKKGFGTRHIKERAEMLDGSVTFDGADGFLVDARIPIRWGEKYD